MEMEPLYAKNEVSIEMDQLLLQNDAIEFANLLDKDSNIDPVKALREICSKDNVKEETRCEFASKLLDRYNAHGSEEPYPVIMAAEMGLHKLLSTLANHRKHPANLAVLSHYGETPIIAVVRRAANNKDEEAFALKSVKILADKKCDLHKRDNLPNRFTAVHLAAKNGLWMLVKFFLSQTVNIDLEIGKETARALIEKHDYTLVENYEGSSEMGEDSRQPLVANLKDRSLSTEAKEESFNVWQENNPEGGSWVNDPYKGSYTLLELAIEQGLSGMAHKLVEMGANPKPALFLALDAGEKYVDILRQSKIPIHLSMVAKGDSQQTVLHRAVLSRMPSVNVVKYLLEEGSKQASNPLEWISVKDYKGWTALHYAANHHMNDVVAVLLSYRANMFTTDFFDQPAFFYLRPEVIEEHLNKQIKLTASQSEDNCGIIFDFNFLNSVHEKTKNHKDDKDAEEYSSHGQVIHREMGPLKMLTSSPIHHRLLLHPLIRAFLQLKWQRVYWFYWLNSSFYLAFATFFFLFVFGIDFKRLDISEGIDTLAQNSSETVPRIEFLSKYHQNLHDICLCFTFLLAVREAWQFLAFRERYIFKLENWLELSIVVLTFWLLFSPLNREVASILSLLITFEMVLLMSRHPKLATYVFMFLQVALNFIKFLLWYLLLIVGFGFAFYIIFPFCQEDKCMIFNTIPHSIFKTVVMISGEYEAGDFEHVNVASHFIFIAFIFFISMVMVNLLNGLAVSDTQQIKNDARLIYCKSLVKFFADIESTLIADDAAGYCNWFTRPFAQYMSKQIILLNNLLADYSNTVTVYLYKNNEVTPDVRFCGSNACCGWKRLPFGVRKLCNSFNTIVFDALQIVNTKEECSQIEQLLVRMQRLEELIESKLK